MQTLNKNLLIFYHEDSDYRRKHSDPTLSQNGLFVLEIGYSKLEKGNMFFFIQLPKTPKRTKIRDTSKPIFL